MTEDDLQGLDKLTLKDKQDQIHKYLKQQKEDLHIFKKLQNTELKQQKKQELLSIRVAMSSGQSKHLSTFKTAAKTKEYFNKPGLLPFPGEIIQRDLKEKQLAKKHELEKIEPIGLKSAFVDQIKFSTKIRSVRFIEQTIKIDSLGNEDGYRIPSSSREQLINSKSSTSRIDSSNILIKNKQGSWLPTSSVPKIFQKEALLTSGDHPSDQINQTSERQKFKYDWLPTSTRPLSSNQGLVQHQLPSQINNPYAAIKNQLQYVVNSHRRIKSGIEQNDNKFYKLEPFKPGYMIAKVFGDPKVSKLSRTKLAVKQITLENQNNQSFF